MITVTSIRIPDSLTELDQWIVWQYEQRDGSKPTKIPYQINGSRASSTDSNTWCSCDVALKAYQANPTRQVARDKAISLVQVRAARPIRSRRSGKHHPRIDWRRSGVKKSCGKVKPFPQICT